MLSLIFFFIEMSNTGGGVEIGRRFSAAYTSLVLIDLSLGVLGLAAMHGLISMKSWGRLLGIAITVLLLLVAVVNATFAYSIAHIAPDFPMVPLPVLLVSIVGLVSVLVVLLSGRAKESYISVPSPK